jgi:hypothetical protein
MTLLLVQVGFEIPHALVKLAQRPEVLPLTAHVLGEAPRQAAQLADEVRRATIEIELENLQKLLAVELARLLRLYGLVGLGDGCENLAERSAWSFSDVPGTGCACSIFARYVASTYDV